MIDEAKQDGRNHALRDKHQHIQDTVNLQLRFVIAALKDLQQKFPDIANADEYKNAISATAFVEAYISEMS